MEDYDKKQKEESDMNTREAKKPRGRPKYLVKKACNCDNTHPCPLENNCNRSNIVYKATINSSNLEVNNRFYIGSATEFKIRWANHLQTFRNLKSYKS